MKVNREACDHAQITQEGRCVKCGLQFVEAWRESRYGRTAILRRNLALGIIIAALFVLAGNYYGPLWFNIGVAVAVFFGARAMVGVNDLLTPRGFYQGRLQKLYPVWAFNIYSPHRTFMVVGKGKFPIARSVYEQFREGDLLLVEFLRWSKLPIALYKARS
ncbi:MAG: hypothetical protein FJ318_01260 [SAR202 cluster bacterium]|nr:hypothetical protein [SAR202 cluster bacterium]